MEKISITRDDLKQNILNEIILRIDYTGIISIDGSLETFEKEFKSNFINYETTFLNRIELGAIRIDEISENLSIPVKELEKQLVHRFTKNTFGDDDVTFDISKYFSVMHINTKDYRSIDAYLKFFNNYIHFLKRENSFLSIKRFGIRKISSNIYSSIDELLHDFESKYFNVEFESRNFKKGGSQMVDLLTSEDELYNYNYKRLIEKGFKKEGDELKEAYQALLDIDGYLTEQNIEKLNFLENAEEIMIQFNDKLFDLFKLSMTNTFLTKNKKVN
jgi:uncharacterized protein (TIGR04255 family)